MEEKDNVWSARLPATLALRSDSLAFLMDLDDSFQHLMYTPRIGRRYILTGESFPVQYGHNDFQLLENTPTGYLVLIAGLEGPIPYVRAGSEPTQTAYNPLPQIEHVQM